MVDEAQPLFAQIAEQVEDSIISGSLSELSRAPSTNELASFYSINPATAAKGVNLLVAKGVLEKRRGIGMFVRDGARELLINEYRTTFSDSYIAPLLTEAKRLGITPDEVIALIIDRCGQSSISPTMDPTSAKG